MKLKILITALLLLTLIGANTGCICSRGGGNFVELMKKVPVDSTSIDYWATGRVADDEDLLNNIYTVFKDSSEANQLKEIGVLLVNIKQSVKASGFYQGQGVVTVFSGSFNIKDVERSMEAEDYNTTPWHEVGIWTPNEDGQGYTSVALLNDTILMASEENLKPCIDTLVKEDEESLYEDSNVKAVVDKLPDGVVINVSRANSEGSEENYEDLIAYGKSYSKESSGETVKLKLTAIYMFQDNLTAGQAVDEIEEYLGSKSFTEIKAEREGNFVRATALIYISDFAQSLTF